MRIMMFKWLEANWVNMMAVAGVVVAVYFLSVGISRFTDFVEDRKAFKNERYLSCHDTVASRLGTPGLTTVHPEVLERLVWACIETRKRIDRLNK